MRYMERLSHMSARGYDRCRPVGDMRIDRGAVEMTRCPRCGSKQWFAAFRHRERDSYVGYAGCRRCRTSEEI